MESPAPACDFIIIISIWIVSESPVLRHGKSQGRAELYVVTGQMPPEKWERDQAQKAQEVQNALEGVRALVSEMGGYMERSEVDNDGDGARTAELTALPSCSR